ncbi:carboxymuconolactone decarboxylase family protein [Bdellovibrio svalbardensis]|uniref:Carboxymuconolactone decarboxylase family protein n=1 Tax=Bdellovibrio svalbardensis TaxID=2972972 RepID=A0ABT6DL76_9BACT|nr:carboxymuconolactone decarboxylase family protein [Bdellovibrio svalbardensis]MDG0817631.1 carboxymuconolactone decarboxylase family protein [Bdellovibrio svalbardensis]
MAIRLNYPKLSSESYGAIIALEKTLAESPVERSIIELVKIRVSQLNGCLFCLDLHVKEARTLGERELRLYHLGFWHESKLFTEKEKAALEWAELLTKISTRGVEDKDFEKARTFFSEKELSDLTFAIGTINMWNRLGVAFRNEPGSLDQIKGVNKIGLV